MRINNNAKIKCLNIWKIVDLKVCIILNKLRNDLDKLSSDICIKNNFWIKWACKKKMNLDVNIIANFMNLYSQKCNLTLENCQQVHALLLQIYKSLHSNVNTLINYLFYNKKLIKFLKSTLLLTIFQLHSEL